MKTSFKSSTSLRQWVPSARSKKRSPTIAKEKWESYRAIIHQLYIVEGKTEEQTRALVQDSDHDFRPSKRQLVSQLSKWGMRKHGKSDQSTTLRKNTPLATQQTRIQKSQVIMPSDLSVDQPDTPPLDQDPVIVSIGDTAVQEHSYLQEDQAELFEPNETRPFDTLTEGLDTTLTSNDITLDPDYELGYSSFHPETTKSEENPWMISGNPFALSLQAYGPLCMTCFEDSLWCTCNRYAV